MKILRRSTVRWSVYTGAALALVAVLSGCTAASPPVLGADGGRVSAIPSEIVSQQGLQPDSVRYLGELNGTKFYAAQPVNSGPASVCLLVNEPSDTAGWGQACGSSSSYLGMVFKNVEARLFPNGAEKEIPRGWQQVGDYLWVREY